MNKNSGSNRVDLDTAMEGAGCHKEPDQTVTKVFWVWVCAVYNTIACYFVGHSRNSEQPTYARDATCVFKFPQAVTSYADAGPYLLYLSEGYTRRTLDYSEPKHNHTPTTTNRIPADQATLRVATVSDRELAQRKVVDADRLGATVPGWRWCSDLTSFKASAKNPLLRV